MKNRSSLEYLIMSSAPFAAKLAEMDEKGDLEDAPRRNAHKNLCNAMRRFWGWNCDWSQKVAKRRQSSRSARGSARTGARAA
jgi:hypothetical protein